jgi:predicted transcriptional regulator YdeE
MEPHFEKRNAFRVLGVEDDACKMETTDPGFHDLWMNRFMSRHDDVQPHSTDQAYYGVWINTLPDGGFGDGRHLAAMAVGSDAPVPDGWVVREIPAAEYAVFDSNLRDVGDATEFALRHWLPNSDYEMDTPKPRFDFMPPDTVGPESPVSVWIPVRRR